MTYLMDQYVPDQMRQIFIEFAPVIEDRTAVKKYHVYGTAWIHNTTLFERHALIKAKQVERTFQLHGTAYLVVGKILDPDHDILCLSA